MNPYQVLREETSMDLTNISEQVYWRHVFNELSDRYIHTNSSSTIFYEWHKWIHNQCESCQEKTAFPLETQFYQRNFLNNILF